MDAANQGVKESHRQGIHSIGLLIALPNHNEIANSHLDIKSEHTRFSTRLDEFMRMSHGVIVAPGGIGTLLELTYTWQLIQVHLMEPRPVVLLGRDFWEGLLDWMRAQQLQHRLINPGDLDFVHLADTEAEVLDLIRPALEKFRSQKREQGDNPRADQAETMLDQVEEAKNQPERQLTLFQNIG
nr:LOG family protein [Armatimonadota bacterium]